MFYLHIKNIKHKWTYRHNPEYYLFFTKVIWFIVLLFVVVSLLAFAVYGAWLTLVPIENSNSLDVESSVVQTINRGTLRDIITALEQKEIRFNALKNNPPKVPKTN